MAFKVIIFAACLAAANAGVIAPAYSAYAAPAYAGYAAPAYSAYAHAPVVAKVAAPVAYAAPAYAAPAYSAYAAPAYSYAAHAPVVAKVAAPVAYAAPAYSTYAHAPVVAKVAAPVAYAAAAPYVAKVAAPVYAKAAVVDEYDANPQYSFAYDVNDALTGDSKSQHETRSGDVVQGSYSLTEPDGSRRTVDYTADPHNGFNAVVHKDTPAVHAAPAYAHAPVVAAKVAAPVAYAAPHY